MMLNQPDPSEFDEDKLEALLAQMQLVPPSPELDQAIQKMSAEPTVSLAGNGLATGGSESNWMGWPSIAVTLVAGLIMITLVGASLSGKAAQATTFQELHGHSTHAEFSDCSTCHQFSKKEDQEIEHWHPVHGVHSEFGTKCSLCHHVQKEKLASELPGESAEHEQPKEKAFGEFHGHSVHGDFAQCSRCHGFREKKDEVIEKWFPSKEAHAKLESNCSMCHFGGA